MKRSILVFLSLFLCLSQAYAGDIDVKPVSGTSLSEFSDAFEVLRRFSSINYDGSAFSKGPAVVFVDERRLEHHIDLAMSFSASLWTTTFRIPGERTIQ